MPPFDRTEYAGRLRRTRARMADAGIDVLISTDPANMNYLTGYDGWSFYTPQGVVVGPDGDPLLYTRLMDANGARVTTYLDDDHILGFPDHYVQHRNRHPNDWVCEALRERGLGSGTVALEMDSYYFTPRAYEAFRAGLPGARLVDSQELVNWVRSVKSPAELAVMREAARIMEHVMQTGVEAVRPGVRQCDAVAAIYAAGVGGVTDYGGEYTSFVPMLPTGIGTSTPHLTWSDRPFVTGEATILELGACRHRYHVPMARTVFLGTPSAKLADTAEVVAEGMDAALATIRPGATCESVEAAWRAVITRHGLSKESRIGYSVGLNYPPDWGEHTMSLRPGDTTELQADMTFHVILGMWMDDWGYELSETVRVTDAGAECFTTFPRRLIVHD
jgi:ectoine utilization protein EutD